MGNYTNEQQREYNAMYFKSFHGVAKRLYHHMKERSQNHKWKFDISYDDFAEWLDKTQYETLYDNWVKSGYNSHLKPSIDRINDVGVYDFNNMRVITWYSNWRRGQISDKNNIAYSKVFKKANDKKMYHIEVTKDNYKKIFFGSPDIKKEFPYMLTSKIIDCCNGKRKTHHGFMFKKVYRGVLLVD